VSAMDSEGLTMWVADAYHDEKRFVVQLFVRPLRVRLLPTDL